MPKAARTAESWALELKVVIETLEQECVKYSVPPQLPHLRLKGRTQGILPALDQVPAGSEVSAGCALAEAVRAAINAERERQQITPPIQDVESLPAVFAKLACGYGDPYSFASLATTHGIQVRARRRVQDSLAVGAAPRRPGLLGRAARALGCSSCLAGGAGPPGSLDGPHRRAHVGGFGPTRRCVEIASTT